MVVLHHVLGFFHPEPLIKGDRFFVGDQVDRDVLFAARHFVSSLHQALAYAFAHMVPVNAQIGHIEPVCEIRQSEQNADQEAILVSRRQTDGNGGRQPGDPVFKTLFRVLRPQIRTRQKPYVFIGAQPFALNCYSVMQLCTSAIFDRPLFREAGTCAVKGNSAAAASAAQRPSPTSPPRAQRRGRPPAPPVTPNRSPAARIRFGKGRKTSSGAVFREAGNGAVRGLSDVVVLQRRFELRTPCLKGRCSAY